MWPRADAGRSAIAGHRRGSPSWKVKRYAAQVGAAFQIGELAERVGVGAKAIRYYEQVGLLPQPVRSDAGYRLYGVDDEERLGFIATARRTGFTLGEIKEILALRDRGITPCDYVRAAIRRRLGEVDRQISELIRLKRELETLDAGARSGQEQPKTPAGFCHILEASAPPSR
jgi:MerR family copper efflux transcriptional regulator